MDMNGLVNVINDEFYCEMLEVLDILEKEIDFLGVVFILVKDMFFVGGDFNMFMVMELGDECKIFDMVEVNKLLFCWLEKLLVFVVVVINGVVLGGGYELCLVSNYCVCVDNFCIEIGLLEVLLGLLFGVGGVVRFINLIGLEVVFLMFFEGKKVRL